MMISAGACGGAVPEEESSGAEFESGAPVEIPVPIAKDIPGIDASSITFESTGDGDGVVGILTVQTVDLVEASIGLIANGEYVEIKVTEGGIVRFELTQDLLDTPLAVVVIGSGEFEGFVSQPVIVIFRAQADGTISFQVFLTNTSVIQNTRLALSSENQVAFSATNSSDEPFIGTVPVKGGSPEVLTGDTVNAIETLMYEETMLVGIDSMTSQLTFVDSEGVVDFEEESEELPDARNFSISPSGDTIATVLEGDSSTLEMVFADFDGNLLKTVSLSEDKVVSLEMDWISDDKLAVAKEFDNGSYALQTYTNIDSFLAGSSGSPTVNTFASGDDRVARPAGNRLEEDRFIYECEDENGNSDICQATLDGANPTVLMNGDYSRPVYTADYATVAVEDISASEDNCDFDLVTYNVNSNELLSLGTGCFPVPHPTNSELIAYLSSMEELLQVGVANQDNVVGSESDDSATSTATRLSISGTSPIATGNCSSFTVSSLDANGSEAAVAEQKSINLTGNGNGFFYSDSSCTTIIATISIPANQSSAVIYFKDSVAESVTLNADDDASLTAGTLSVTVSAGLASTIVLSGSTSLATNTCSSAYTVGLRDSSGNTAAVSTATQINLTGGGNGTFYSDATCATQATSINLAAGASSGNFYFRDGTAQSLTLNADDAGSLTAGTLAVTISATVPDSPTSLSADTSATVSRRIDATWNAVGGASSYRLYRSTTSGFTLSAGTRISSSATSPYADTGLSPNVTYYYKVSTVDANSNESNASTEDSAITQLLWTSEAVDSNSTVTSMTSLAVDSSGKIHIGYYDSTGADLKYATNSSGAWVTSTVDSGGDVGTSLSLALDSNGKVHMTYRDNTNLDVKYATNTSGDWVTATVDGEGTNVGLYTSIAIDSSNKAHVSYRDSTNGDLKYATNSSGAWVMTSVDTAGFVGSYTDIALDSSNKAHISYYHNDNLDLKYATNSSGAWVASTIDSTGTVGMTTSITVDGNGKIHISYYDLTNGDLKYATDATGSWVAAAIDSTGNVGSNSSIVVDSSLGVHISYRDITNDDLKYITNASGAWYAVTIDSTGSVGSNTAIGRDSSGKIHISYQDTTNADLKYAREN